jgi:hypothetical protein
MFEITTGQSETASARLLCRNKNGSPRVVGAKFEQGRISPERTSSEVVKMLRPANAANRCECEISIKIKSGSVRLKIEGETAMNVFFRRSINEYQRQFWLKETFVVHTKKLQDVIESLDWAASHEMRRKIQQLLLLPLVEIAWADGRVSRRESDVILEVAKTYGLVKDEADYCELLGKMTSRPAPLIVGQMWRDFQKLFENLPEVECRTIAYCLSLQTQFVAEQSSDNLLSFLRGERICEGQREALKVVAVRLENALETAKSSELEQSVGEIEEAAAPAAVSYFESGDWDKLVPLVPLVKTAWAEGRVTKRERHLVFEAAMRMGVKPGTPTHRRLAEWLELHPTDEFYDISLDALRQNWQRLDTDEKTRRKIDLLSECTRIAEASGGSKNFAAGGAKICDEEISAVKRIARRLNGAATI